MRKYNWDQAKGNLAYQSIVLISDYIVKEKHSRV